MDAPEFVPGSSQHTTISKPKEEDIIIPVACPICRKVSYFVIPSTVWITDQAEKERLISDYKNNTGAKPCRHFQQGNGVYPFGNVCFYSHALPDGTEKEVDLRLFKNSENETKLMTEDKGEMSAPVSLASMMRQAELEQEGEQE
ncbi:uncharacterized protein [Dysidea avara]|uniref:uncharacterized protein isoform X1 n=1 Tax=Dysidea avara TaxID=196820 RepID=UPI003325D5C1